MSKKLLLNTSLMLTLTGGVMVNATVAPLLPLAAAQAHLPAAPATATMAAIAVAPNAAPLTPAQMSAVRGAGLFSFFKDLFKTVKKAIAGAIVSFITNLVKSWVEQLFGVADGGAKQQQTQTVTENYRTQAEYDAGIVYTTSTVDSPWITTESWSGGCGGGGYDGREGGMLYQEQMISAC